MATLEKIARAGIGLVICSSLISETRGLQRGISRIFASDNPRYFENYSESDAKDMQAGVNHDPTLAGNINSRFRTPKKCNGLLFGNHVLTAGHCEFQPGEKLRVYNPNSSDITFTDIALAEGRDNLFFDVQKADIMVLETKTTGYCIDTRLQVPVGQKVSFEGYKSASNDHRIPEKVTLEGVVYKDMETYYHIKLSPNSARFALQRLNGLYGLSGSPAYDGDNLIGILCGGSIDAQNVFVYKLDHLKSNYPEVYGAIMTGCPQKNY